MHGTSGMTQGTLRTKAAIFTASTALSVDNRTNIDFISAEFRSDMISGFAKFL